MGSGAPDSHLWASPLTGDRDTGTPGHRSPRSRARAALRGLGFRPSPSAVPSMKRDLCRREHPRQAPVCFTLYFYPALGGGGGGGKPSGVPSRDCASPRGALSPALPSLPKPGHPSLPLFLLFLSIFSSIFLAIALSQRGPRGIPLRPPLFSI